MGRSLKLTHRNEPVRPSISHTLLNPEKLQWLRWNGYTHVFFTKLERIIQILTLEVMPFKPSTGCLVGVYKNPCYDGMVLEILLELWGSARLA
jgi:hypothetical protein